MLAPVTFQVRQVTETELRERLDRYVMIDPNSGCWLWSGCVAGRGYGVTKFRKISPSHLYVHRLVYEVFVAPVPDGLYVCHRCDVPACCNPDHLFLGTHTDNMRDAVMKGRVASRKTGTWSPGQGRMKLDDEAVRQIRAIYCMGFLGHQFLAHLFGVSNYTINSIVRRKSWKHVD